MTDPIDVPARAARSGRSRLIVALGLIVLAGGLRFVRIGHWPFAYDEVATFEEIDSLIHAHPGPLVEQRDRLPRMVPLGFLANYAGDRAFGKGEGGSRTLMAIFGTLGVVMVFALLDGPSGLGRPTAVATAILVAVWPEHLLHSQNHRFYMTAWLCSASAMLLGGRAVARHSVLLMIASALMALAAIAAHTLQGMVLFGLGVGVLAASRIERRPAPLGMLAVVGVAWVVAGAAFVVYVRPLGQGWNGGEPNESPLRSLLSALNHVGWPTLALAGLGVLILRKWRPGPGAFWTTLAATWLGATLALPRLVPYSVWYGFAAELPLFVLAGASVGRIYELIRPSLGPWIAAAWIAAACTLDLPATVSYYADGSRPDYREVAHYINDHWRDGDRVVAQMTPGLLPHYLKPPARADYLQGKDADEQVAFLEDLARRPGRLWVVVAATRAGLPWKLRDWLGAHCTRELTVRKRRFDYSDNVVELYALDPAEARPR